MFYVLRLLYAELAKINTSFYRDPRTSNLPLVGSPLPMATIVVLYFLFVKKWGPALMANRKPLDVKVPMQIYNVMQVLLNLFVCFGSIWIAYFHPRFLLICNPYNPQDTGTIIMNGRYPGYVFYMTKYLDLFDTVFFVLRKKDRQASFLHVYHHAIMVYGLWAYMTLAYATHFSLTGVINSFVHVLMYSYYFMAAMKTSFDLNPWKRVLTMLQIAQFCLVSIHFAIPILWSTCQADIFWSWIGVIQNVFMLAMFTNFYIKTYSRKPQAMVGSTTGGKSLKAN